VDAARVNSLPRAPTHWPSFHEDVVWEAMREFMSSSSVHVFPSTSARPFPAWDCANSGCGESGQDNLSHEEDDAMDICFDI